MALQGKLVRLGATDGTPGLCRIDAITQFLTGHLGKGPAASFLGVLYTKAQVEAYEGLMKLVTSRGVPAPKSGGIVGGRGNDLCDIPVGTLSPLQIMGMATSSKSSGRRRGR